VSWPTAEFAPKIAKAPSIAGTAESRVELRVWQQEALSLILARPTRKGVVTAPMGSGKTRLALELIERLGKSALVVVPTIELCDQWRSEAARFGLTLGTHNSRAKLDAFHMVTTYASAVGMPPSWWARWGVVIFDEVHRTEIAAEWGKCIVLGKRAGTMLGLSGTVDQMKTKLPIIYTRRISEAVGAGDVSPVTVVPVPVDLTEDEQTRYRTWSERIAGGLRRIPPGSLYSPPWTKDKMRTRWYIGERRRMVANLPQKIEAAIKIARDATPPVLIFTTSIGAIEKIVTALGEKARPFHSKMPTESRIGTLSGWREGKFPILVSAKILDEGVNVPAVRTGVLLVGDKTARQAKQRAGRIMRKGAGGEKVLFVVYARGTSDDRVLEALQEMSKDQSPPSVDADGWTAVGESA